MCMFYGKKIVQTLIHLVWLLLKVWISVPNNTNSITKPLQTPRRAFSCVLVGVQFVPVWLVCHSNWTVVVGGWMFQPLHSRWQTRLVSPTLSPAPAWSPTRAPCPVTTRPPPPSPTRFQRPLRRKVSRSALIPTHQRSWQWLERRWWRELWSRALSATQRTVRNRNPASLSTHLRRD